MDKLNSYLEYFQNAMCWMEKYIEKAGFYSDWEQRKQIQNNLVIREDMNGPKKEDRLDNLSTAMHAFITVLGLQHDDDGGSKKLKAQICTAFQEQFHRWIDSIGITNESCPTRLKLVLFAFYEILKGSGEKLRQDIENRKRKLDPAAPEYQEKMAEGFQTVSEVMKKMPKIEPANFQGNLEKGRQKWQQIANSISEADYQNFYWCEQKDFSPDDNSPEAQAATAELTKIIDKAKKVVSKNDPDPNKNSTPPTEIEEIIIELTEFKNNSAAHDRKNDYAWRKLDGAKYLAKLQIELRVSKFDCKNPSQTQNSPNRTKWYWIGGISIFLLLAGIIILLSPRQKWLALN